jgi:hypothetical protein
METKVRYLTILLVCLVTVFMTSSGFSAGAAKDRPTISDGERAMAVVGVQNTWSKHVFYHQVGQHCEEMDDIWVKADGAYSKTATWSGANIEEGISTIRHNYCEYNLENKKKALEAISKVSDVKDVPENIGAGNEYVVHMLTTPIIEIAGDGKTAKGIWYTPGIAMRVVIKDGKAETGGTWMFEKYAVDFAKEDGKWKIWHMQNIGDPGPPGWGASAQTQARDQALDQAEAQTQAGTAKQGQSRGGRIVTRANPNPPPPRWSPTTVPKLYPKFPEPYYTFSETFSY